MVADLITLPLRATGKAARLWWRAVDQAIGLGFSAGGYVIERVTPARSRPPATGLSGQVAEPPVGPAPDPSFAPSTSTTSTERPPAQPAPRVPEPQSVPPTEEPTRVSEEPALVQELAEPGAEDGAGAELHIREPWEGYRHMSAHDVTARLSDASAAELAAVQLFENSHQGRRTILAAVGRRLREVEHQTQLSGANGGGSQP